MNVFTVSFVALLILKVTELASISWWIVFTPVIVMLVLWLAVFIIAAVAS